MTTPRLHNPDDSGNGDLLSFADLCSLLGVSAAVGERLKAAGKLPPHIALSKRTHRWRRQTVEAFLARLEQETARRQAKGR